MLVTSPPIFAAADRAGSGEPLARLHRLLLSLFGSSEQFRRWIVLGPRGQELAAELSDRPASMSAALLDGIDVLARRGHVDRGFFARLTDEFPLRADDIRSTAAAWTAPPPSHPTPRPRPLREPVLVLLALLLLLMPAARLPRADVLRGAPDDPFTAPQSTPVVLPDRTHIPSLTPAPRPTKRRPALAVTTPPPACLLSPTFTDELSALARETLRSPALLERFTVILHAGSAAASVSPRPLPGQAARRRIHERLLRISTGALDECRDTPVDIALSPRRATVTPRPR